MEANLDKTIVNLVDTINYCISHEMSGELKRLINGVIA